MSQSPAVEMRGVVKRFGDTVALDGVDLSVPTGAVYGLLGPNGAGKTTSVRVLTTLLTPDAGEARIDGIEIFKSVEIDILKDGSLDMPDDILEGLDVVVISVHSFMDMDRSTMTDRVLKAMAHPTVDILAHPTGRRINRREPFEMDVEAILEAAADLDIAVELNANPNRLDLRDTHVYRARELGVPVVISTDAHAPRGLADMRFGVDQARRGWLGPDDVLNTRSLSDFRAWLNRRA